ncbi:hypothetical protein DNTS_004804 [Danionella cerebrum]|uniref:Selenoprotein W n=1 Tax=Danionella cerebrum TaxID=2873325 RepID=A0A553RQ74_9TELE|nr:hypothetical protein DNTS_004804 [Danionella translucida]TRZ04330.1 hypothetical protein DNTS_004804 [Danionella translucida]
MSATFTTVSPRKHNTDEPSQKSRSSCQHERQGSYHLLFTKLKTLLEDEFPDELEITGEGTPSTTGWFEVEVNSKLVHSKKNGEGFVDSDSKMKKIVAAIEQALGK